MTSETQQRIIDRINAWQANDHVHPLTCGIDSRHRDLVPYIDPDARVRLKCLDCTWTQDVPSMFGAEADAPSPVDPTIARLVKDYADAMFDCGAWDALVDEEPYEAVSERARKAGVALQGAFASALAALQQDRDRLTWLETQIKRDATETFGIYQEDTGVWLMADGRWVDSLRAAIDAARSPGDQPDV